MMRFMLLMRGSQEGFANMTETEQFAVIHDYTEWAKDLKSKNILGGGSGMSTLTIQLERRNGQVFRTERPYQSSKDELSGYFIIEAADMEEAIQIAYQCPALRHGESVEIVPLVKD